ncbi:ABC transporter substrate-binding protein [Nonlabens spongiae]|uniref:ABC transporter substrate-binding protein n=1 Tax=Nonlabens spongiae TaxID=331648 RepID=A0A1W6MNQ2_9FLAO|nr:ABC transporter substrate-binding protein [Nonlabens spongiae]ARN79136.1 ABC transporter substrate-binding protein [Nonlabens spongiae]
MNKKGNLAILLLLLCTLFLGLESCQSDSEAIDPATVFRYNEHANVTTLDPAFAKDQRNIWVCNQLYNGLVRLDKDLNVVPDLAGSWDISEDGTLYTFRLKRNIHFHNTELLFVEPRDDGILDGNYGRSNMRTVNAEDFKYSLSRLTDPEVASPGAWTMAAVEEMTAIDEHTLQIKLKQPNPAFLGILTMKYCSVIPKEVVEDKEHAFRSNPIGTGPFYLKRWEENVKMVLRKNPHYHEEDSEGNHLPYLEAVAITFKPDKQSEFLEFVQGNLDFINALDPSYKDELLMSNGTLKPKYKSQVNLVKQPFLNTEYLGLNLKNEGPLQDIRIRRAINLGFDRHKMIRYLKNNIGRPATSGFIPLGLPAGGNASGFIYDQKEAQSLVDAYKAENNVDQVTVKISTGANYLDICEFIQQELQKIGLIVEVEVLPPSTLRQMRKTGKLESFRSSWIADYPDAENYLALFYSENHTPSGSNYTFFENKTFDSLYLNSQRVADPEQRKQLYRKMDSILIDQAPVVPLYYDESIRFVSKNVIGLEGNAVNALDLKSVRKGNFMQ